MSTYLTNLTATNTYATITSLNLKLTNYTLSSALSSYALTSALSSYALTSALSSYANLSSANTFNGAITFSNANTFNGVNTFITQSVFSGPINVNNYLQIRGTKTVNGFASGVFTPTSNVTQIISYGFTFSTTPVVTATLSYRGVLICSSIMVLDVTDVNFQCAIINTSNAHCESQWYISWTAIC
jgi:hypothetical protein